MSRKELKKWLEEWLIERPWDRASTQILKCRHRDKYDLAIKFTDHLKEYNKFAERIYIIINELYSIPSCPICDNTFIKFHIFDFGYFKTCCDKKCIFEYEKIIINPETGLTAFQTWGKISQKKRKLINPETGIRYGKEIARKIADKKMNTIDPETGFSLARLSSIKSGKTKSETINPETGFSIAKTGGLRGAENKRNNIDPISGLNMLQRASLKSNITKKKNGTLTNNSCYSKECTVMVKEIIDHFKLDENENLELYYGDKDNNTKKEWTNHIQHKLIKVGSYDFVIINKETKIPLITIEYHGSAFHINKEKYDILVNENRDEFNHFKNSFRKSYEKDQIKKIYMIEAYGCEYLEIFDYEWKENKEELLLKVSKIIDGK